MVIRKKCPKCGSAQMFSQTCSTCGTSLAGPVAPRPQASVRGLTAPSGRGEKGMPWYGWVLIAFGWLLVIGLLGSPGNDRGAGDTGKTATHRYNTDFKYAMPGEYWVIEDDDIAVLREPKESQNKAQFVRNVVTIIGTGTVVEILETEGMFSPAKRVYVYRHGNEVYAKGWILAETVKGAKKISEPF